jgi:hypothetical protein
MEEPESVEVVMDEPVNVENHPLFVLEVEADRTLTKSVLAVPVEKAMVDPKKLEVAWVLPTRVE